MKMEMESRTAARTPSTFMATLPPQMIKVEKTHRASRCETIVEETGSGVSLLVDEECVAWLVAFGEEVAPAPVITVRRPSFRSSLDTIWEDTMQYVAGYLASDAIVLRSYSEASEFSSQLCFDSQRRSSGALNFDRSDQLVN